MASKRLIRLLTALIPMKRVRKRVRARWLARAQAERLAALAPRLRARYGELAAACRAKLQLPARIAEDESEDQRRDTEGKQKERKGNTKDEL